MVVRYLKGEYLGENRNIPQILRDVSSHVEESDAAHIERILTQGCPLRLSFKETPEMKAYSIKKAIK